MRLAVILCLLAAACARNDASEMALANGSVVTVDRADVRR